MTCEEALQKLYDIIDEEATKTDIDKVHEHLLNCKDCMSRYQFEKMFRHFIVEKASSQETHNRLRDNILKQISSYSSSGSGRFGNPFKFGAVVVAAIASLVICIAASFSVADSYRHRVFIKPFEDMHYAEGVAGKQNQPIGLTIEAENYVNNHLHLALKTESGEFKLAGGRCYKIVERQFSHLRFLFKGEYVSLLAGKADGIKLPGFKKITAGGYEYYRHTCCDCQMIYWYQGDAIIIAITEKQDLPLEPALSIIQPI